MMKTLKTSEYVLEFRYYGVKFQKWVSINIIGLVKFIFIALALFTENIYAQNLVLNSSFEEFNKCPVNFTVKYRKELIPGWFLPSRGTADYFNSCTNEQVGVPQNFMGYCLPKDGMAYAGLILLLKPPTILENNKPVNYREYLQTRFSKELEKDKVYEVTFYYSVASFSTFAINRLGVYISREKINNGTAGVMDYRPQISSDSLVIDSENGTWFCFRGNYKAKGGEKYLTLGNFYNDYNTQYKLCDFSGISSVKKYLIISEQISYYYIDKVSVIEVHSQ